MVLEQVLNLKSIERRGINVFILAVIYTFVGIICARAIFPDYAGLMSVAFTSILLIPSLGFILQKEENVEIREKKFSLPLLFRDHKDIFRVYLLLFLGIFFAYTLTALLWPNTALLQYFGAQTAAAGFQGQAFAQNAFVPIVLNNLLVFVVCFVLSIIYGSGAILFLTWNASVWGIVIGFFAKEAALSSNHIFVGFFIALLPFLPHLITEALSYIGAAIVGGVVSKAVLREKLFSKKFHHILTDALMLLIIAMVLVIVAAFIEVSVFL